MKVVLTISFVSLISLLGITWYLNSATKSNHPLINNIAQASPSFSSVKTSKNVTTVTSITPSIQFSASAQPSGMDGLKNIGDKKSQPKSEPTNGMTSDNSQNENIAQLHELHIKAITKLLNDKPNESLAQIATSNFNSEKIDYEWSFDYENKIKTFFSEAPDFLNFSPDSVECRSARCKAIISIASPDQFDNMSRTIIDAIYKNKNNLTQNASVMIDEKNNALNVYFEKTKEGDLISDIQ